MSQEEQKPELKYLTGLGNFFESQSLPESLPIGQNNPQKAPYGLYPEQLTGSPFTMSRGENLRTWLYRIRPSVGHGKFEKYKRGQFKSAPLQEESTSPEQIRWKAIKYPIEKIDFLDSIFTLAAHGDVGAHTGAAIHLYACNKSMEKRAMVNSDGEFLIVPQEGGIRIQTEMGVMEVNPLEIAVVPRGIKFSVAILEKKSRGYICENYGAPFVLPDLGPIGSNGLANPRDFQIPEALFQDEDSKWKVIQRFLGVNWVYTQAHSPFDVVAWHGNYVPFKYDLTKFNTINTVSYDHPDPSIFTVLTSPTDAPGRANVDFVIFPPRWMVAENTFRPPYFHRNIMSEYMGLIQGQYDAKAEGFVPGGGSLHNCMVPHGPDKDTFKNGSLDPNVPEKFDKGMAFMFESFCPWQLTKQSMSGELRDDKYLKCWQGMPKSFPDQVSYLSFPEKDKSKL